MFVSTLYVTLALEVRCVDISPYRGIGKRFPFLRRESTNKAGENYNNIADQNPRNRVIATWRLSVEAKKPVHIFPSAPPSYPCPPLFRAITCKQPPHSERIIHQSAFGLKGLIHLQISVVLNVGNWRG